MNPRSYLVQNDGHEEYNKNEWILDRTLFHEEYNKNKWILDRTLFRMMDMKK